MTIERNAEPTAFFVGVLAADADCLEAARVKLEEEYGSASDVLPARPFTSTNYYEKELGSHPLKTFFAYEIDFPPDRLAERKRFTNQLEKELAATCGKSLPRPVNLDPGYLAIEKLVLASAKNYSHRICLSGGIYAEVTLCYTDGRFQTLPWTFPDYGSGEYFECFLRLRKRLMQQRDARKNNHKE